jgi:tRNA1(Val) A37 N6-methylase TrmN6
MTSTDKFLDGRILLQQPIRGYRAGIDAVLLASAIHPRDHDKVLDVGCGVGAVMHCISAHHPKSSIVGLELQEDMVSLCRENIALNSKQDSLSIVQGDIFCPPEDLEANSFDHVVSNPPYFDYGAEAGSESSAKSAARHLDQANIAEWVEACLRMVKPRGYFTMIHRANQMDSIVAALKPRAGGITVFPLWPDEQSDAKLVIIQARKGVKSPSRLSAGLVLHKDDKSYTEKAKQLFRGLITLTL